MEYDVSDEGKRSYRGALRVYLEQIRPTPRLLPADAALLMSLSSIVVALNAVSLRRTKM